MSPPRAPKSATSTFDAEEFDANGQCLTEQRAEHLAASQGVSLSVLARGALEEYLTRT